MSQPKGELAPELTQVALQKRLLVLILMPLALLGMLNAWADYRLAGSAAGLQDEQLTRLMPLLGNAVMASPFDKGLSSSVVMLVPAVQQFLTERGELAAFKVTSSDGRLVAGDARLSAYMPRTYEAELHSETLSGVTWRVAAQRLQIAEGQDVILQLADGSGARQEWLYAMLRRVILPNVLLSVAVFLAVRWGVRRALAPLVALQLTVERREPTDLSPIDVHSAPQEVSPLVRSLNRLFASAEQQNLTQRRFVADAAHQLRTPLAALQAEVQAWVPKDHSAMQADDVVVSGQTHARFVLATRRAAALAHQLLTLSRTESGVEALDAAARVDMRELIEDVLADRLDAAQAKGVDLGLDVPELDQGLVVNGQPWMLHELLLNLVDNAINYTPSGGSVTIQARRLGGMQPRLVVDVHDTGPGVSAPERALVVQRFYRSKATLEPGNGLGLAIAQEIAQFHGSKLALGAARDDAQLPGLRIGVDLVLCENHSEAKKT